MIKWRSLFIFFLTLTVLFGPLIYGAWYGYEKGLDWLSGKQPQIMVTPKNRAAYKVDEKVLKSYVELKKNGYIMMLPKDYELREYKDNPTFLITGRDRNWEVAVEPKLMRFDDSIESERFLNNPNGDYFILLNEIFENTNNPILLAQKMRYLPSNTTHIKKIETPYFKGFYIIGKGEGSRTEVYRLFDNNYWHNINVSIYDTSKVSHKSIENIIASIQNDYSYVPPED